MAADAPVGRLRLDIAGEPYITKAHPVQEMTIYGNGFRLGDLRVGARAGRSLSIMLMPQWWFCDGRRATMHLAFAFQSLCLRDCESWLGPRRVPQGG